MEPMEKKKKNGLITQCPVCGGNLADKVVEKLLRGGNNTASVKIEAQVCLSCGERLYSPDVVKKFENIRKNLIEEHPKGLRKIGKSYTLA